MSSPAHPTAPADVGHGHTSPRRGGERRETAWLLVGLCVVAMVEAWMRLPAFTVGGVVSHDVSGILYSAMVLDAGGLPYVDTVELKAPGTFYLARWLADGGRDVDALQRLGNAVSIASTIAIGVLAAGLSRASQGPAARRWWMLGICTAALYGLHLPWLDSMDANYVTWANGGQVLGVTAAWWASRTRRATGHGRWWLAGALLGCAVLCKRQAVAGIVPAMWWAWTIQDDRRQPRGAIPLLFLGVVTPHLAVLLHFAQAGAGGALLEGYVTNRWGWTYVGVSDGLLEVAWEGICATSFFLAMPIALGVMGRAGGGTFRLRRPEGLGSVAAWLVATLVMAWIGGRFYKGYFVLTLGPACVLGVALAGQLGKGQLGKGRRRRRAWILALLLGVGVAWMGVRAVALVAKTRAQRSHVRDPGIERLVRHVEATTSPEDRIWVWGWHLWDLYPRTGRMSGSRIYKSLGVLTPPNDDTWRRGASPLTFQASARSGELIDDLRRRTPALIILGSTVPREDFEELQDLLRTSYELDRRVKVGRVQCWRRRSAS